MKILDSPLLVEFISYLKANWTGRSRVDQRRRRLRQLVAMVRAVADAAEGRAGTAVRDSSISTWLQLLREQALRGQQVLDAAGCDAAAVAGSTRRFLSGLKSFVVCSAEVDRLTEAVEELEGLAGPGGDLDLFVKVLRLDEARATAMDVDGRQVAAARCRPGEASGSSAGSVAAAGAAFPLLGAKRKRACSSGVDSGSTSQGPLETVDQRKRRVLAWARPHQWLPTFGGLFATAQKPALALPGSHSHRARTVAMAMARVRRRIGKPTRRRRQPSLGLRLSRMSLKHAADDREGTSRIPPPFC